MNFSTTLGARGLGATAGPSSCTAASARPKAPCPRHVATRAVPGDHPTAGDGSPIPDTLPVAAADSDWRAFRARLVASTVGEATGPGPLASDDPWAHYIPSPERGCLLLASPLFFTTSQTYFRQAVILIADHGPQGSQGFIINRPTEHTVADINKRSEVLPVEFNSCRLYLGGDVNMSEMVLVHGKAGLKGNVELLPGVFLGTVSELASVIAAGEMSASEVKVVVGMAGWGPGQLESEVARGVWTVAAASHHLVLSPAAVGAGEATWHATLQLMGGDFAGLSAAMQETLRPDIMGLGGPGSPADSGDAAEGRQADHGHNHGSGI